MIPALITLLVLLLLILFLLAPGLTSKKKNAPFYGQNIAHRGLYSKDQSTPENSLAAFNKAANAGYGMELDVQLSKDGKVVVFHDDTLNRVCEVNARVDSLDYEKLQDLRLCGTDERIPLFSQVLKTVDGRTPMIVELKSGPHNRELCEKTLALLKEYKGDFCVESFDPTIVAWFRFHAPRILRGQLSQPAKVYKMKKPLGFILGNTLLNCIARPQFIAYMVGKKPLSVRLCEALGAMKVCWTSHDKANEHNYDVVIFEHYLPKVKYK